MSARVEDFLRHHAQERPDALAFSDEGGGAVTYDGLLAKAEAMAERYRTAGVRTGDRVLILTENGISATTAFFGACLAGATAVPINARQSAREIDKIITHAEPAYVVFCSDVSEDAATHATRLQAEQDGGVHHLARSSTPDSALEDVAVLLYTTGTTGDPKGVMLSHGNVRFGGMTSARLRDMTPDDLIYGVLPLSHVFGLCSILVAAVHTGAPVRLAPRFSAGAVYDALRDGVTLFSAVPQMHALIMAFAKAQGLDRLGSDTLRYVSSGAAPLDPTWKREAEAFYGVAVQNGYGMTESTAGIAATRHPIGMADISVGPPLPGVEVRIDRDQTGEGDDGGEILTRGPHVMKGYFRNAEATQQVLDAEGWLRTGDLGLVDGNGYVHVLGRLKELIIRGGFNVYPPEVEAAINDHPEVIQAAVIGRSVGGDEEVLAFCQVSETSDLTEAALRAFLETRLTGYKRPARIIMATQLPAAPTGKILKHKLLDVFANDLR